jgi:hypothetical protein
LVLLTLAFGRLVIAQTVSTNSGWRGLSVDVSTPEDAVRVLGKPSSDKSNQSLNIQLVDKWLVNGKHNKPIFRKLIFGKVKGVQYARLSFLDDKLVMIHLDIETGDVSDWIRPDDLSKLFNCKFAAENWHFHKKLPPLTEFQAKMDQPPPKKFTDYYDMIAVSDRAFI